MIGAALPEAPLPAAHGAPEPAPFRAALAAFLGDLRDPVRLGQSYLAGAPGEADRTALTHGLGAARARRPSFTAWLERRRRQDFACGAVVVVDGWVLARIEARACALMALG